MLDFLLGGAIGTFVSAALVNQFSNRVAGETINVASEEVNRFMDRIKGDKNDPETKYVIKSYGLFDLGAKVKLSQKILSEVEECENPTVQLCVQELKKTNKEIDEIILNIEDELQRHSERWFKNYRFSNVGP